MKNSENENGLTDLLISVFFSSSSEKQMLSVKESKRMNYTVMGRDSIIFICNILTNSVWWSSEMRKIPLSGFFYYYFFKS